MADTDPPIPGASGETPIPDPSPEHSGLLYDPTAPLPYDAIEGFGGPEADPAPRSRTPVVALGFLLLVGLGSGAFWMTRSSGNALPPVPPMIEILPGSAASAEGIIPIPLSTVEGEIGSELRVAFRALGQAGAALADTLLTFTVESGEGVLVETGSRTNSDGIAAVSLRLPGTPGSTVVVARVPGSRTNPGRMVVIAVPGIPARIQIVSGNGQQAEIGELLPSRVFVLLEDTEGNPVPNAEVRFQVISGDGITAPSQTRTDSLGRASALWRLGLVEGVQRLTAASSDNQAGATFTATALPPTERPQPGQPGPIETAEVRVRPLSYAVGGSHVCALSGNQLACRGGNDRGQTGGNGLQGIIAVAAGAAHSCGLDTAGEAVCWGGNDGGQLGDGSRVGKARPTTVRTDLRFSLLAAGASHTCGLAGGGVPLCWGLNLSGQLGDGTRNDQSVPRTVGGGLVFSTLMAGWSHTCGLTSNGNAFCWGDNSQGQLGDGSTLDRLIPTLVRGAVETLVAGSAHTCGISKGEVLCWGGNSFGQLGDGTTESHGQPSVVQGLPSAPTELAAGAVHTCALVQGGRAFCWGQNLSGQLGDGTTGNRSTAVAVSGGMSFREIHAGGAQTCARGTDGAEYCWGLNQSGQLGDGTRVNRSSPTRVGG